METEQRPHVLQTGAVAAGPMSPAQSQALGNSQTVVGQTQYVIVYTDGTAQGNATAQVILQNADADFTATQTAFGGISLPQGQEGDDQTVARTALPIQVLIDPQAGGAYHFGCNATDIYLEPDPTLATGFFVAELVEIFEATINNGWDCGQTNGEALSRVLAGESNSNLGGLFVQTEQSWWTNGHVDYVNDNSADDTNQDANGCGTLFLYYLHSQLNFDWPQITAAGGATLGATYQQLTGQDPTTGFATFVSLLSSLDTGSGLNLPATGNPFPLLGGATQAAPSQEVPVGAFGGYSPSYGNAADYGAAVAAAVGASVLDGSPNSPDAEQGAQPVGAAPDDSGFVAVVVEEPGNAAAAQTVDPAAQSDMQVVEEVEVVPWTMSEPVPAPSTAPGLGASTDAPDASQSTADSWLRPDDLSRTGPVESPRGLDAAPALEAAPTVPRRRKGEVIETMIAILVVLIVLVALGLITVLFANNIVQF